MAKVIDTLANEAWADALCTALNQDPRWTNAARWYSGTFELRHESGSMLVGVADGVASVWPGGGVHGSDVTIEADDEAWSQLLEADFDFLSGGAIGRVVMRGNLVLAMHEMRTIHFTLDVMRRLTGLRPPAFSPDPTDSNAEVAGRYIDVAGIRTHYEEAGAGIPILCIHAAAQDSLMYRHVLNGLSDRFRVIAVDAPGHGKTAVPAGGLFSTITEHAEFNERFMAAIGLEQPVIMGCSMGGNMVLELGARRPTAYRAIISCEGAAHTPTIDDFTIDMLDANGAVLVEPFARSLTGCRTPRDRADEVVWQISRSTPAVMKAELVGCTRFDQRANLHKIQTPTLLIRGAPAVRRFGSAERTARLGLLAPLARRRLPPLQQRARSAGGVSSTFALTAVTKRTAAMA